VKDFQLSLKVTFVEEIMLLESEKKSQVLKVLSRDYVDCNKEEESIFKPLSSSLTSFHTQSISFSEEDKEAR
jgi:hypothetical protein